MDLLCLDQTEVTISIAAQLMSIPTVYKKSRCVKVLIESPVCKDWLDLARQVFERGPVNKEVFGEEELAHGRKCPNLLFRDPWFKRLWTRQEGLYAYVIHIVALDTVPCERLNRKHAHANGAWIQHGTLLEQRNVVESFIQDKLSYHGVRGSEESSEDNKFSFYFDIAYRHRVNMLWYNGEVGPARGYLPVREAWSSERITKKVVDYVLAVFPDVAGYKVPDKPHEKTFQYLLRDAIGQLRAQCLITAKVPRGMMTAFDSSGSSIESIDPWLLDDNDVKSTTEAYDTLLFNPHDGAPTESENFIIEKDVALAELDGTNLSGVKNDWVSSADVQLHTAFLFPSGPCTGARRADTNTDEGLLLFHFCQEFASIVTSLQLREGAENLALRSEGAISFGRLREIHKDKFARQLKRFLTCMICGTSLRTADLILQEADVVCVSTSCGNLLGLVRAGSKPHASPGKVVLLCNKEWRMQGFLLALVDESGVSIIGRTVIPSVSFFDKLFKPFKIRNDTS